MKLLSWQIWWSKYVLSLNILSSMIYVDRGVFAFESRHESIVLWPKVNSSSKSYLQVHLWRVGVRYRLHQALLYLKTQHWDCVLSASLPRHLVKMEVFLHLSSSPTSARGWCTGKTQRDRVEREVGGGIGMGNTWNSMADSCQCMTKTTTIL